MGQREDMAAMAADMRKIRTQVTQRPVAALRSGSPDTVEVMVRASNTFDPGNAVVSNGGWSLLTSQSASPSISPVFPRLWGIVSASGPGWFKVVVQGQAKVSGVLAGYVYAFGSGVATALTGLAGDTVFQTTNPCATSHADGYLYVSNDAMPELKTGVGATFSIVTHASIGIGNYVVYAGCPSGSPLAQADSATPWKFANVGIALFEFGAPDSWLVLTNGEASYVIEGGDYRPVWLQTAPWLETGGGAYARMYLSESTPGQYATSSPTFKVYAGRVSADYTPASGPTPAYTTIGATAIGTSQSMHWDAITEKPAAFPPSGSITLNVDATNTTDAPSLVFSGSIGAQVWDLYEKRPRFNAKWLRGTPISTTAPTSKQFVRFDGTEYTPYGPLLSNNMELLSHNGTDLAIIAAPGSNDLLLGRRGGALTWAKVSASELADGSACSVLGRSANSTGVIAAISAASNATVLKRVGDALSFGTYPYPTNKNILTSGSSWTVPAGVYRVYAILIGGGGGAATGSSSAYYVASSSGGSPTTLVYFGGGGGGAGGMFMVEMDVTPGGSVAYSIGAAGADSTTAPTAGGSTTFGSFTVNGGGAGGVQTTTKPGRGGAGGTVGSNPLAVSIIGDHGGDGNTTIGSAPAEITGFGGSGYGYLNGGATYGDGSSGGSTATQGAVILLYIQ